MKKYDYVLAGSGLFAGVFAYFAKKEGKTCLVVEKRGHLGGNIYCEDIEGIHVLNTAPIFSTPATVRSGISSTAWWNLTGTPTARWQTTRARCTTCLST